MAQSFTTDAATLIEPGAYADVRVQSNPTNLGTNGVVVIVGEADGGAQYSEEESLGLNAYGPSQYEEFAAKYRGGRLVDGFRGVVNASNDEGIPGAVSKIIAVQTNKPVKASGTLAAIGGGTYGALKARGAGKAGNMISRSIIAATAEQLPTTGAFLLVPPQVNTDVGIRVNGSSLVTAAVTAAMLPTAARSALDALAGVAATGGTNRGVLGGVAGTLTLTVVSGFDVTITIAGAAYGALPQVGDLLYIPTGSPFAANNEGSYVVTAASGAVITARKLLDAAGAGAAKTAPTTEAGVVIAATTDLQGFAPIVLTLEAGAVVPGLGKSLEVADTATGELADVTFVYSGGVASAASWVSTAAAPKLVTAAQEYSVTATVARQADGISDALTAGGLVALTLGYKGTTGSCTISGGTLTTTVAGGAGTNLSIALADWATVQDLADFIASQAGYVAAPGDAALGQTSPLDLDAGTYGIGTTHGVAAGRIKADGKAFLDAVAAGSSLVTAEPVAPATKLVGLPDVASLAFLTGGSRGSTSNADVLGALNAMKALKCNFVVPLFSQDATADIASSQTDAGSTYTIEAINANTRAHVLEMSKVKRRRRRIALCSYRGTFKDAKAKARNTAASRVAMAFQDCRDTNSAGNVVQFQCWMTACKAAGMQAAGGYRPIVNKYVQVNGFVQAAGDFNDQLQDHIEDALKSGLLVGKRDDDNGGFKWVSDQTTYTKDNNWVFNSIQAIYVADIVASTCEVRMERDFVGQSVADIDAGTALLKLEGIMEDMMRLKYIARSDDAPKGFRNAKVKLTGPALEVSCEIGLAGGIYFVPITLTVTQVVQTAGG